MIFEKITKDVINDLKLNIDEEKILYAYKDDSNNIIGMIAIYKDCNTLLDFYITDKYQGQGYGKKMVKDALSLLKMNNYKEVDFVVNRSEIKAIKIITSLGGQHLSNIENLSRYKILL